MPHPPLQKLIITPRDSVRDAMCAIDRSGLEVALVCDPPQRLVAVITDGDIRRALLRGVSLTAPIAGIGSTRFKFVPVEASREEAVALMIDQGIKCLPVIGADGTLAGLHTLHVALVDGRSDSWAVIMAGGKGERLGDLTQAIPKPMLPVGDRPILERIVQLLVSHGIRRIFISINYLGRMIQDHFGDGSRFHCRITYLNEDKPLGTGGALSLLPEVPTEPLLLMNGDLLTQINLGRMLAFHRAGGHAMTMALRDHKVQVAFGVAETEGNRVVRLVEKPSLAYQINAGIYIIQPEVVAMVPKDEFFPITNLIERCIAEDRAVGGYHLQESWSDIGMPQEFWAAHHGGSEPLQRRTQEG